MGAAQSGVVRRAYAVLYSNSLTFVSHIDDCTQEWTFSPDSLDYVHMRYLIGSIVDWRALFREAFRCCKPGGYIESLESAPWLESDDGTLTDETAMSQWGKLFVQGGLKIGRSFTLVDDDEQRKGMEAAGFVDIQQFNIKVSILSAQNRQSLCQHHDSGSTWRLAQRPEAEGAGPVLPGHSGAGHRRLYPLHGHLGGLVQGGSIGLRCEIAA